MRQNGVPKNNIIVTIVGREQRNNNNNNDVITTIVVRLENVVVIHISRTLDLWVSGRYMVCFCFFCFGTSTR